MLETNRQTPQQQLQSHQVPARYLQSFWSGIDVAIVILDVLDDGAEFRYVAFNPAMAKITLIPVEQLLGKTLTEALPKEMLDTLRPHYTNAVRSQQTIFFEEKFDVDGKQSWWKFSVNPLQDDTGLVHQLVVTANNITDRIQANEALQASVSQYRDLVQTVNGIILRWDVNGKILFINDYGSQFFGFSHSELIGQNVIGTIVPKAETSGRDLENLMANICQSPESFLLNENENICKNGKRVWIAWSNKPIFDSEGNLVEILSVGTDASDRKAAEEALRQSSAELKQKAKELESAFTSLQQTQTQLLQSEKMSSLGQLVAGVAHEINNPTSFIYSNLEPASRYIQDLLHLIHLYQENYPNPVPVIQDEIEAVDLDFLIADLPKLLSSIKMGAQRIKQIVLSLRNFSRMDEAECKAVNIHDGIDSTLVILEHRLKAQPNRPAIQVITNYGDLPPVECYPGQINQVFMNILVNALDALEERDASRTLLEMEQMPSVISITTEIKDSSHVVIRIADNGEGIPEQIQQRLFDPFFTTKPLGKGTGMGLSISYQIITEKHGGSLECISSLGKGTEFAIAIPIEQKWKH